VQYFQNSLLNLCILEDEVFRWPLMDSVLCDLKFLENLAHFYSPGE